MSKFTYSEQACEKLERELKGAKLSTKANAVKNSVMRVLQMMCRQEEEFAQAIVQTEKTVDKCIEHTVAGCGNSISDIKVYRRAAEFYFPGAAVGMTLTLDLTGCAELPDMEVRSAENEAPAPKKRSLEFSFDELF